MKRVFALVLTLATALGLAACNSGGGESGENVVRIGIFEPATGDNGAGGKQEMLGMQYANKETPTVDIGGTTYTVELVYADNGSDPAKAPTAAAELVSKDVSVVLGSYGSTVSLAGGPVFGEAGVPAIGVGCTNPRLRQGTGITSGSASWIRSRERCWQISHRRNSLRKKLTAWVSWATSTTRA